MSEEALRQLLAEIEEPIIGGDLLSAGIVENIQSGAARSEVLLTFPYPAKSVFADIVKTARAKCAERGLGDVRFSLRLNIHARIVQGGVERIPKIKNIIAVASAKGGVGKSTTAVNLAMALANEGASVGILDADIYGPSIPVMLGVNKRPRGSDDGGIIPLRVHDLQLMSIGFMVDEAQPMVWRGPIATRALMQLLRDTRWEEIDYLLLDMPPGTGDIQLTIAQQVPVTGAIVVTTPQALAVADAERGLVMFNKVSVPVLGLVENMSTYYCPKCGHEASLFGSSGGEKIASRHKVELLGQLPLVPDIGVAAENGTPLAITPDSEIGSRYRQIAVRAAAKIAQKTRDRSTAFPKIVVSK